MKLEVDSNATHLRAMRDTLDDLRTWMSGFQTGVKASSGAGLVMPLSGYELHLGQIRRLLCDLMRQAEDKDSATTKKR